MTVNFREFFDSLHRGAYRQRPVISHRWNAIVKTDSTLLGRFNPKFTLARSMQGCSARLLKSIVQSVAIDDVKVALVDKTDRPAAIELRQCPTYGFHRDSQVVGDIVARHRKEHAVAPVRTTVRHFNEKRADFFERSDPAEDKEARMRARYGLKSEFANFASKRGIGIGRRLQAFAKIPCDSGSLYNRFSR